ncbi:MAG: formylglycine-generating enzyme family protein [bacterium]
MDMVYIYADDFTMGSNKYEEEEPRREIFINTFWICKYTVTNKEYRQYVKETGTDPSFFSPDTRFNSDNQPVVGISFYEAAAYCEWLKEKTGLNFRLPYEAEWEKAAGGPHGRKYPWGNCWEHDRCQSKVLGMNYTAEVDRFPYGLSPYCLYNMAGNVWEWCQDWYSYNYYRNAPRSNPRGPQKGAEKCARGGSWNSNGNDVRITKRGFFPPETRQADIGFRLVCDNPIDPAGRDINNGV